MLPIFKIIKIIFRGNYLAGGIFFLVLSYLAYFLPQNLINKTTSLFFGASYYLGVLLIADYITVKVGGFSIISRIFSSARTRNAFIRSCTISGIIFSLIAADLGGLWYFPYWSIIDYFVVGFLLGGWIFYILTLIVSYEACKIVLDKFFLEKKMVTKYYKYESHVYSILFMVGLVCVIIVGATALYNTLFFTDFKYVVSASKEPYLTWEYWIIGFFGSLFICEFIEYRKRRSSLLKDAIHGYFNPLLAIVIVSIILSLSDEIQNMALFLWRYANFPFPEITLLNIPIFIIIAWPLHILAFAVVWRTLSSDSASDPLFGNDEFVYKKEISEVSLS